MAEDKGAGGVVPYSGPEFEVLKRDVTAFAEIIQANMGDVEEISEFDLERVGIPGSGGLSWTVPDIGGEPENVKSLEGIVLMHGARRAYWEKSFDDTGGGSPPDCSSMDARRGIGHIRGESTDDPVVERSCKLCPMAQWGSGKPDKKDDNSQACTQRKLLFLLREGDILPLVVDLAPTSISAFTKFMLRLSSKGVPTWGAIVGLGLANENSTSGIKYSVVAPRLVSVLGPEDQVKMKTVADALRPYFTRTGVEGSSTSTANPEVRDVEPDAVS